MVEGGEGDPEMAEGEEEPQMEDRIEPMDGKCPDGYTLSEDGSMCVRDGMEPDEMAESETKKKQPGPVAQGKPSVVPHAALAVAEAQSEELDQQIASLQRHADSLAAGLRHAPRIRARNARMQASELARIQGELARLHGLKKKSAG